ncbi:MAG: hypothetical protein QM541_09070 [Flavobacterium sp.]|nr:hypothetical protein [Flavobacterium sp.]
MQLSQTEIDEIENAQASRFLSVDPLTNKFAMLTPYQYASNSPIENIDMDGLEAFSVHGTNQGNGLFQNNKGAIYTPETKKELLRITGNKVLDEKFRWNAPLWNSKNMERKVAAYQLAGYVIETRARLMDEGKITESEPISLIGYSHGGNVSIQAAKILNDYLGVKVNLVTVSTPAYTSVFYDPEDPAGNKGVNSQVHITHSNDDVWFIAGGLPSYPTADNYYVQESEIPLKGGIEAHTDLPESPKLAEVIKKIPEMKKAPVPTKVNEMIKKGKTKTSTN